ncbi:unnamed protein product [Arabidopsis halleri]
MTMNLEQAAAKKRRTTNRKGKRKVDENTDLIVKIGGFTIDDKTLSKPYYGTKNFRTVVYTDLEDQYPTRVLRVYHGDKLKFNEQVTIPIDSHARYLYVELLGVSSREDPGTSRGIVVMGRAKIRLPPPLYSRQINHKASLVALDSDRSVVEKGTLAISMKLDRYVENL